MAANTTESRRPNTTNESDTKSVPHGFGGVADYSSDNTLEQAFEHPNNNLLAVVEDLYPDAVVQKGRIKAVWRGGDDYNVVINNRTMYDHVSGESHNPWTFLTKIAGYSDGEAAKYLKARAGLGNNHPQTRKARRQTKQASDKAVQKEAYLAKKLEDAHEVQRTGATNGHSAYFERKGIAALFETHEVPDVMLNGERVPGMVYSSDKYGPFVQFVLRALKGEVTGYQRIYDAKVLPGERDKDFIGAVKGSFILLQPKGVPLPRDGKTLAKRLAAGYEVGTCEGFATGASIALARLKTFVLCALSKNNLEHVLAALRARYGSTRYLDNRRKVIEICVWGDNDKSGSGQEAAHLAALNHDAYVRLPAEQGDFNDLHQNKSLEAVRRTRKVTPNAKLAFGKELTKQNLSATKELPPFALPQPGEALIVRAPQETGKTHQLAVALAAQPDLWVVVVVHRVSLAKSMAKRLKFDLYSDVPANLLRSAKRLVITYDSLYKLMLDGTLPPFDLLVLDESEQVLEHTTGRQIKRKADNNAAFEGLLRDAPSIVLLDADAGSLTVNHVRRTNPSRRILWHTHEYRVAESRRMDIIPERDDALDALEAEERPTWYATDSLRHSRDLSAYLNDPKTLTINSETSGEGDAAAYLLNPTREATKHQRLIASPSVQTGVSDDSKHFQHVILSNTGHSSTPQDAIQAAMRARGAQQVTAHVPRSTGQAITIKDALEGAADLEGYEAGALDEDTTGHATSLYERLKAEVTAQRSGRKANYRQIFALKSVKLGYDTHIHLPVDLSAATLERRQARRDAHNEAGLVRYVEDRASAARIDADDAKTYGDELTLTREQTHALEQYQLRSFYGLPDNVTDADLREMLRRDDYGDLRRQVIHYEAMLEPREVAQARAREENAIKGDRRGHMLRHDFAKRLAAVIGLDTDSEAQVDDWQDRDGERQTRRDALQAEREGATNHRKGVIDKALKGLEREAKTSSAATLPTRYGDNDGSVKALVMWCGKHYRALRAARALTCPLEHLTSKPLEVIGDALRRCGLTQTGDRSRTGRTYAVTLASISAMRNFSRPRRKNWDFAQQTDIKDTSNHLLREIEESTSYTVKVTDAKNMKDDQDDTPSAPPKPFGYEALRFYVLERERDNTREALLESFGKADEGDKQAIEAIAGYLQKPEVQALIGAAA